MKAIMSNMQKHLENIKPPNFPFLAWPPSLQLINPSGFRTRNKTTVTQDWPGEWQLAPLLLQDIKLIFLKIKCSQLSGRAAQVAKGLGHLKKNQ